MSQHLNDYLLKMYYLLYFQVADAFPADAFGQIGQQVTQSSSTETISMLKKPPKWLCRPAGASFAVSIIIIYNFQVKPIPANTRRQPGPMCTFHKI